MMRRSAISARAVVVIVVVLPAARRPHIDLPHNTPFPTDEDSSANTPFPTEGEPTARPVTSSLTNRNEGDEVQSLSAPSGE